VPTDVVKDDRQYAEIIEGKEQRRSSLVNRRRDGECGHGSESSLETTPLVLFA
jgi:hypothetical protein